MFGGIKVNVLILFLFLTEMLVIRTGIHKMHVRIANGEDLTTKPLKKLSDLGLPSKST